jgi:hypothetical protein
VEPFGVTNVDPKLDRQKGNETMPSAWDASIKLLYAVDQGTFFAIDDVTNGDPIDVIANVEIGENLNENVDSYLLRVAVRNLTQSSTVQIVEQPGVLTPGNNTPYTDEVRVQFPPIQATAGDVLQAVASYKVLAGSNVDFSTAESNTFVVS